MKLHFSLPIATFAALLAACSGAPESTDQAPSTTDDALTGGKIVPASFRCVSQGDTYDVTTHANLSVHIDQVEPGENVHKVAKLDAHLKASLGGWTEDNGQAVLTLDSHMFTGKAGKARIVVTEQDTPAWTVVYSCSVK
jgi:hypothetical protein